MPYNPNENKKDKFIQHFRNNGYISDVKLLDFYLKGDELLVEVRNDRNEFISLFKYEKVIFFDTNYLRNKRTSHMSNTNFFRIGKWIYEIYQFFKIDGFILYIFDDLIFSDGSRAYRGFLPSFKKEDEEPRLIHRAKEISKNSGTCYYTYVQI